MWEPSFAETSSPWVGPRWRTSQGSHVESDRGRLSRLTFTVEQNGRSSGAKVEEHGSQNPGDSQSLRMADPSDPGRSGGRTRSGPPDHGAACGPFGRGLPSTHRSGRPEECGQVSRLRAARGAGRHQDAAWFSTGGGGEFVQGLARGSDAGRGSRQRDQRAGETSTGFASHPRAGSALPSTKKPASPPRPGKGRGAACG